MGSAGCLLRVVGQRCGPRLSSDIGFNTALKHIDVRLLVIWVGRLVGR